MRKSRLLASAAVAALIGSAAAIDSASAQDWNGLYLGVNVGAGFENENWRDIEVPSDTAAGVPGLASTASDSGILGGLQLGWNQQMGPWVWGAEFSFDGSTVSASTQCFGGFSDVVATCGVRNNYVGDFTGRLGGTVGPALIYLKAGGTFADEVVQAKNLNELDCTGCFEGNYKSDTSTRFGWTIGFGAEVGITDDVSMGLEYDYRDFGSFTANMVASEASPSFAELPFDVRVHEKLSTITLRINYKLD